MAWPFTALPGVAEKAYRNPRFFKTTRNSTNVASGRVRTTSRITVAWTSSRETLPPRGFA
jgi:hypothetical protein